MSHDWADARSLPTSWTERRVALGDAGKGRECEWMCVQSSRLWFWMRGGGRFRSVKWVVLLIVGLVDGMVVVDGHASGWFKGLVRRTGYLGQAKIVLGIWQFK